MSAPPRTRPPRSTAGFAFAIVAIVVCTALLIVHLMLRYQESTAERNRVFALDVVQNLFTDVHEVARVGGDIGALDDGGVPKSGLRLGQSPEASGNFEIGGGFVWGREIRVAPLAGIDNRALHTVTVVVTKRRFDGLRQEVVKSSTAVATVVHGFPATRVLDLHLIAIENVPARDVPVHALRPSVESVVAEYEREHPGLAIRTHWITKSSYGRDPHYAPEVGGRQFAYSYPGPGYAADAIRGRIRARGDVQNGRDMNTNPLPYALADRFNHALRLPAERAFHAARTSHVRERKRAIITARERTTTVPQGLRDMSEAPTLRLFLEDLHAGRKGYRDALVLNLHGDVLPVPPLRGASDAARDPVGFPGARGVTRPLAKRTPRGEPLQFEVELTSDRPRGKTSEDLGAIPTVEFRVYDMDLTDEFQSALRRGVRVTSLAGGGDYSAEFVDPNFGERKFTKIVLRAATVSGDQPARWRLTVPKDVFGQRRFVSPQGAYRDPDGDARVDVETVLGNGLSSSRTYAWWADDPNAVPITERLDTFDSAACVALWRGAAARSSVIFGTLGVADRVQFLLGGDRKDGRYAARQNREIDPWRGDPHRGELVPDPIHGHWRVQGNLPLGSTMSGFRVDPAKESVRFEGDLRAVFGENCVQAEGSLSSRIRSVLGEMLAAKLARDTAPPRVHLVAPATVAPLADPDALMVRWDVLPEHSPVASPASPDASPGASPGAESRTVPMGVADESKLAYALLVSADDGATWQHLEDGSLAEPGVRPRGKLCYRDERPGPEERRISLPESRFAAGAYRIRIELYEGARTAVGAHHTRRITIDR